MNSEKIVLLIISSIPFLTNLYVTKYLHDIKENEHCNKIDSYILTLYYDFYITSTIILFVSIIGIILAINEYTDLLKFPFSKKLIDIITSNSKLVEILSIIFSVGLLKLIHDFKKEPECEKIDHGMASNIYYYSIIGVVFGVFSILGIKLY